MSHSHHYRHLQSILGSMVGLVMTVIDILEPKHLIKVETASE